MSSKKKRHIVLTSHPRGGSKAPKIQWGAATARERGPIVGTTTETERRNVIGTHSGSYGLYRALAVAAGALAPDHRPDLTDTNPVQGIGPHPSWHDPAGIVSFDPWGHMISEIFADEIAGGLNIQPTIAITRANMQLPEVKQAMLEGRLEADGEILLESGDVAVLKAAIEPVWYLPGIAERFDIELEDLRRALFEYTGGMYPELVTRYDIDVLLPPIGGLTAYMFGDISTIPDRDKPLAVRVHDECNGSDVFGSDICTCRPYLLHGIEVCIEAAQRGGAGVIAYFRKEGRALGEVTKFLVYNARKRQDGGDRADAYFTRTECVAGVQDVRFQQLMPDVLHWLGVEHIDQLVSMSNAKYDAIVGSGISVGERISIPDELVPPDARVEIDAKKAAGYYTEGVIPDADALANVRGRSWEDEDLE